jgi:hypothetical protein
MVPSRWRWFPLAHRGSLVRTCQSRHWKKAQKHFQKSPLGKKGRPQHQEKRCSCLVRTQTEWHWRCLEDSSTLSQSKALQPGHQRRTRNQHYKLLEQQCHRRHTCCLQGTVSLIQSCCLLHSSCQVKLCRALLHLIHRHKHCQQGTESLLKSCCLGDSSCLVLQCKALLHLIHRYMRSQQGTGSLLESCCLQDKSRLVLLCKALLRLIHRHMRCLQGTASLLHYCCLLDSSCLLQLYKAGN